MFLLLLPGSVCYNPLSANVMHARHDADVICSGCSASYRQKSSKMAFFERGENLLQNDILHFVFKPIVRN